MLFRQKGISSESRNQIDKEIGYTARSGMLNITGIFQEVIDRFNHSTLAKYQPVI